MMRQVLRDYVSSFRWERIREAYKGGSWWIYPYFLLIAPTWFMHSEDTHSVGQFLLTYAVIVPILFGVFEAPLVPIALPKIMYLCPMSEAERRAYLVKTYLVKILIPIGASTVLMISLGACGAAEWFTALAGVTETMFMTLASSIGKGGFQKTSDEPLALGICQGVTGVIAVLLMIVLAVAIRDGGTAMWEKVLILAVMALIQLPLTIKVMSYLKPAIQNALDYERSYR